MTIADLQRAAWLGAEAKGFHEGRGPGRDDTLVRLALVVTEVAEAIQIVKRQFTHDGGGPVAASAVAEELADVLIRVADLAECLTLDLEAAVAAKLAANRLRPRLYGTAAEGTPPGV